MDGFNHLIIRLYKPSTNEVTKNVTFVTAPFTYVSPRIHHHPAAQEQPLSLILSQAIEKNDSPVQNHVQNEVLPPK